MVRTLGDVAYVPKMRRNLISLSQYDSEGYAFSAVGGVLKITHGGMMKGEKCQMLYHLIGNTTKTSIGSWEWRPQHRISHMDSEKTRVIDF